MGKLPLAHFVSLAVLSAGSLFCANVAMAETQTAKSGNVQAQFSSQEGEPCFTKPSLQIIRQGQTILDQPLSTEDDGWRAVQQAYQESDRSSFFKELRIFLQQTGYIRNPGQTEFYRLAQLEKTGIYNKCPQGTRLSKAGETVNYRFGLCSGNEADYYLGASKRGGESITIQRQSNDPINSFRKGEYVYRLSDEKGSANMYLEVFQGNRQLRREMIQKVYRW